MQSIWYDKGNRSTDNLMYKYILKYKQDKNNQINSSPLYKAHWPAVVINNGYKNTVNHTM